MLVALCRAYDIRSALEVFLAASLEALEERRSALLRQIQQRGEFVPVRSAPHPVVAAIPVAAVVGPTTPATLPLFA